jgi:serine/threonine protein kinase
MSTILHPYLNHSEKIYVSEKKLYIIQDLAKTDLAQYTRCHKENYRPSTSKLKFWCYCLIKALSVLHSNNIIHSDIKASNILLYHDDSIKLSDFNLSVLKSNKDSRFTHKICTRTHCPLEVLKKSSWNEAVDIWSLGCTFYEIAYGMLLFPCQNGGTKCYINSILEWTELRSRKITKNSSILKSIDESTLYPIEYNSPLFCDESKNLSKIMFNDLLYKMLISDQYKRPNIKDVSEHPFITNLSVKYQLIKCINNKIPEYNPIINYISNITDDNDVINLSVKIYNGIYFITEYTQELKAITCTLIASKLLHKNIPEIQNDVLPIVIAIESNICNNLTFHFNW